MQKVGKSNKLRISLISKFFNPILTKGKKLNINIVKNTTTNNKRKIKKYFNEALTMLTKISLINFDPFPKIFSEYPFNKIKGVSKNLRFFSYNILRGDRSCLCHSPVLTLKGTGEHALITNKVLHLFMIKYIRI